MDNTNFISSKENKFILFLLYLPLWLSIFTLFFIIIKEGIKIDVVTGHFYNPRLHIILWLILYLFILNPLIKSILWFYKLKSKSFESQNLSIKIKWYSYWLQYLKNLFFTILSFGIYYPWMKKSLAQYQFKNISFNNKQFLFKARGTSLYIILCTSLFIIITVGIFDYYLISKLKTSVNFDLFSLVIISIFTNFVLLPYIIGNIIYYIAKWKYNFKFDSYNISFRNSNVSFAISFLGNFLLSIISLGIYTPQAYVNIKRMILNNIIISQNKIPLKKIKSEKINKFLNLWLYIFLSIVTLGLFIPFMKYFINKAFYNNIKIEEI